MTYAPPGCFSLKDLVNPSFSAMPFNADEEEAYQTPRRSTPFRARQRSEYPAHTTPLHQLRSLVDDDRNDDASVIEEPKVLFEQVYVLTRQVRTSGGKALSTMFILEYITNTIAEGQQGEVIERVGVHSQNVGFTLCCKDY